MKKLLIVPVFLLFTLILNSQIIADHTVVDSYADIPQEYIDIVKTMWLSVPGESHSGAYRAGLSLLEDIDPTYAVSVQESGTPESYTTAHLRVSRATWGDIDESTGWIYGYGEEDWWTSTDAIARTKAGLSYCDAHGLTVSAFGFGWCWDAIAGSASSGTDPVTGNHWYGWSDGSPSGNMAWGIDDEDNSISGNSVNLNTYLEATAEYIAYCTDNSIATNVFYTTGPVDTDEGMFSSEAMYQAYLKYQRIREFVKEDESRILFDYADILCYDDDGSLTTGTWNENTYPLITETNLYPIVTDYHISEAGALRLAKALWWMLARMAGWDGQPVTEGIWVGGTADAENDWNTASNWYGKAVPSSGTDAIISATKSYQPVISGTTTAECENLTLNDGASLTISSGAALTVNGDMENEGSVQIVSSSVSSNGSLLLTGTYTGDGTVTYDRVMPASLYRYFSSPVSSASLPAGHTYWLWNESSGQWEETTSCECGRGYTMLADGGTTSFTGAAVKSATQIATAPYYSFETHYLNERGTWGGGGWNLLGNPFLSAMNAQTFISDNSDSFNPSFLALFIYDGAGYTYIAYNVPGFEGEGSYAFNDIQVGQGFFVLANYNEVSFNFTSEMQTQNTSAVMTKSTGTADAWPGLLLTADNGETKSTTIVVFNDAMTTDIDPGYDVGLFDSGKDISIYTTLVKEDNGVNYTRQALPLSGTDTVIVPLGIDFAKGGEITFSASTIPADGIKFWLEDKQTGSFTDLATSEYKVTLPDNTYGTGRFFIIASGNEPADQDGDTTNSDKLRIWASGHKIIIKGNISSRARCEIFTLDGRKILYNILTEGELNTVDLPSGVKGIILVKVSDGPGITTAKIAIPWL